MGPGGLAVFKTSVERRDAAVRCAFRRPWYRAVRVLLQAECIADSTPSVSPRSGAKIVTKGLRGRSILDKPSGADLSHAGSLLTAMPAD